MPPQRGACCAGTAEAARGLRRWLLPLSSPHAGLIRLGSPGLSLRAALEPKNAFVARPGQRQRRGPCRPEHGDPGPARRLGLHGQRLDSRTARSLRGVALRASAAPRVWLLRLRAVSPAMPASCVWRRPPCAIFALVLVRRQCASVTWATAEALPLPGGGSCGRLCLPHGGYLTVLQCNRSPRSARLERCPLHAP